MGALLALVPEKVVFVVCEEESKKGRRRASEYIGIEEGAILTNALHERKSLTNRRAAELLGCDLTPDSEYADLLFATRKMRQLSRVLPIYWDIRLQVWRWCK